MFLYCNSCLMKKVTSSCYVGFRIVHAKGSSNALVVLKAFFTLNVLCPRSMYHKLLIDFAIGLVI